MRKPLVIYDFAPDPFKIPLPFLTVQRLSLGFFFSLFLVPVWQNKGFTLFGTFFRTLHKTVSFFMSQFILNKVTAPKRNNTLKICP